MGKRPLVEYELSTPSRARLWLREVRFQKDLRAWEVARMANICENYYTKIELGVRSPSVKLAKKLGEILDFSWIRFFEDTESAKKDTDTDACAAEIGT